MRRKDVLTLLAGCPGHLEVFLKGMPVTGVDIAEDDEVVAMPSVVRRGPTGRLRCLKVRDLLMLLSCRPEATDFLVGGSGMDGVRIRSGRISNDGNRRRFVPDAAEGRDVILTFTRLMDFSDGTRHLVAL